MDISFQQTFMEQLYVWENCCLPYRQVDNWRSFQCPERLTIHWVSGSEKMRLYDAMELVQGLHLSLSPSSRIQTYFKNDVYYSEGDTRISYWPVALLQECPLCFPVKGNGPTDRDPAQKPQFMKRRWSFTLYLPSTCRSEQISMVTSCCWLIDCVVWR